MYYAHLPSIGFEYSPCHESLLINSLFFIYIREKVKYPNLPIDEAMRDPIKFDRATHDFTKWSIFSSTTAQKTRLRLRQT